MMDTKEEKAKTVSQIIEDDTDDEDQYNEMIEKVCSNCPLDRL